MSYGMSALLKGAYDDQVKHMLTANERFMEMRYGPDWREVIKAQHEAERRRIAELITQPPKPLTLNALLEKIGWTEEYAEHYIQPYCKCVADYDGGWDECSHSPGGGGGVG